MPPFTMRNPRSPRCLTRLVLDGTGRVITYTGWTKKIRIGPEKWVSTLKFQDIYMAYSIGQHHQKHF